MTTLEAPPRTGSRRKALELLDALPEDLSGDAIRIRFESDALVTTSFVDELVMAVLVDRRALALIFAGLDDYGRELAESSARTRGVLDRLTLE